MKQNGKLSLALHALGHMAREPDRSLTSDQLAAQNATHPVVVRRVLGLLRDQGILRSEKGHAGGWRLARPAAEITVAQVYQALGERLVFAPLTGPEPGCAIVHALRDVVAEAERLAEAALLAQLATRSIGDLAQAMRGGQPHKPGCKLADDAVKG